ncbi:MAG: tRNA (adenosine(37)-N6)-threonylcarbamoyltransferase complex dimerization subunit type 1 TsaB [Ruminiclostridium sp.]|nr:tRNA (adenosine(37)-N6)-threonylcarbamoyltransferase complex dimerization subunit type 1 TsaB [Ruminiclostridium sp.]
MLILGIDTAAAPCCAAVYDTDKQQTLGSFVINNKLTHSVTLMPVVSDLLRNSGITTEDIDLFAVANGPGSFTGLRIGISAVKGMAFAASKPCAAVSTLEAMAYNVAMCDGVVCASIDARCNQVYTATFLNDNGTVTRLTDEECLKADELAARLSEYDGDIILVGDGAQLVKKAADEQGIDTRLAPDPLRFQTGYGVCLAAMNAERIAPEQLMPMYLKLPQAQRELMAKNADAYKEERKD